MSKFLMCLMFILWILLGLNNPFLSTTFAQVNSNNLNNLLTFSLRNISQRFTDVKSARNELESSITDMKSSISDHGSKLGELKSSQEQIKISYKTMLDDRVNDLNTSQISSFNDIKNLQNQIKNGLVAVDAKIQSSYGILNGLAENLKRFETDHKKSQVGMNSTIKSIVEQFNDMRLDVQGYQGEIQDNLNDLKSLQEQLEVAQNNSFNDMNSKLDEIQTTYKNINLVQNDTIEAIDDLRDGQNGLKSSQDDLIDSVANLTENFDNFRIKNDLSQELLFNNLNNTQSSLNHSLNTIEIKIDDLKASQVSSFSGLDTEIDDLNVTQNDVKNLLNSIDSKLITQEVDLESSQKTVNLSLVDIQSGQEQLNGTVLEILGSLRLLEENMKLTENNSKDLLDRLDSKVDNISTELISYRNESSLGNDEVLKSLSNISTEVVTKTVNLNATTFEMNEALLTSINELNSSILHTFSSLQNQLKDFNSKLSILDTNVNATMLETPNNLKALQNSTNLSFDSLKAQIKTSKEVTIRSFSIQLDDLKADLKISNNKVATLQNDINLMIASQVDLNESVHELMEMVRNPEPLKLIEIESKSKMSIAANQKAEKFKKPEELGNMESTTLQPIIMNQESVNLTDFETTTVNQSKIQTTTVRQPELDESSKIVFKYDEPEDSLFDVRSSFLESEEVGDSDKGNVDNDVGNLNMTSGRIDEELKDQNFKIYYQNATQNEVVNYLTLNNDIKECSLADDIKDFQNDTTAILSSIKLGQEYFNATQRETLVTINEVKTLQSEFFELIFQNNATNESLTKIEGKIDEISSNQNNLSLIISTFDSKFETFQNNQENLQEFQKSLKTSLDDVTAKIREIASSQNLLRSFQMNTVNLIKDLGGRINDVKGTNNEINEMQIKNTENMEKVKKEFEKTRIDFNEKFKDIEDRLLEKFGQIVEEKLMKILDQKLNKP